ncbi:biotin-dependent carboxyltransferase family protein [Euzebya tangerina]|uniref:5-oxoprolinase subunit C family protein n=1 Tax=Euzebya tangerina TaxID=591198 RepID=UPI0013C30FC7|nr:biotin-dependent carboxyltransferase family protein [Euzebya tangerina]
MRFGVPRSGPIDRVSFGAANAAVGNPPDHPALEVTRAGLALRTLGEGAVTVAIAGPDVRVTVDGRTYSGGRVLTLRGGQTLRTDPGPRASWAYVAPLGTVQATQWLGSVSTHAPSALGGQLLQQGDVVDVVGAQVDRDREGEIPGLPDDDAGTVRLVLGPQADHVAAPSPGQGGVTADWTSSAWTVTPRGDRMGLALSGRELALTGDGVLSIPSQPVLRGSIQVDGTGQPTVLLADHQTTGGYPKIATVISTDVDRLAQRPPGDDVHFEVISPAAAVHLVRVESRRRRAYLSVLGQPERSLAHTLARRNLIGGVVGDGDRQA